MPRTSYHVEFEQCSSRRISLSVTSNRSRSEKALVGTSRINSLASSGFTEQHASPSEPQWRATPPAVFQAATPSAYFNYSRPVITINRQPVTSRAPPQDPHNASCVFTERVNKRAYHLQPSINCGDTPPHSVSNLIPAQNLFVQYPPIKQQQHLKCRWFAMK
jgi:hypothetical protein